LDATDTAMTLTVPKWGIVTSSGSIRAVAVAEWMAAYDGS
jgi:hypothetical protein